MPAPAKPALVRGHMLGVDRPLPAHPGRHLVRGQPVQLRLPIAHRAPLPLLLACPTSHAPDVIARTRRNIARPIPITTCRWRITLGDAPAPRAPTTRHVARHRPAAPDPTTPDMSREADHMPVSTYREMFAPAGIVIPGHRPTTCRQFPRERPHPHGSPEAQHLWPGPTRPAGHAGSVGVVRAVRVYGPTGVRTRGRARVRGRGRAWARARDSRRVGRIGRCRLATSETRLHWRGATASGAVSPRLSRRCRGSDRLASLADVQP